MKLLYFLTLTFNIFSAQINTESYWIDIKNTIVKNDFSQFTQLINSNKHLIDTQDKMGMTFLMYCCIHFREDFVKELIKLKVNLDLENDFAIGKTALQIARLNKYQNIEELLIEAGAKK